MASSGALATPNNNCTNGNGSASSASTRTGSANLSTKKTRSFANIQPYCGILTCVAMELPRGSNWQFEHFAKVLTQTTWEFTQGVHPNVVIDKCDPKNHKGASYSILVWDIGQRVEKTCSTHHVEPTNATNFG